MKPDKALNIARGVFGLIAAISALVTFILFGAQMDFANFPGSNLELAVHEGGDKDGQLKQVLGGWEIVTSTSVAVDDQTPCTNFVVFDNTNNKDSMTLTKADFQPAVQVCATNEKKVEDWSAGWLVAPDCKRTTDENECAPFGANSPLAWFGFITFGTLSLQVILFGVHTCYELTKDALGKDEDGNTNKLSFSAAKSFKRKSKVWLGLTIIWIIVGFSLMAVSAFAWDSLCDKIDTGLGRKIGDDAATAVRACATTSCTLPFSNFFGTMVFALVWYRLPHIAQWFGLLESV